MKYVEGTGVRVRGERLYGPYREKMPNGDRWRILFVDRAGGRATESFVGEGAEARARAAAVELRAKLAPPLATSAELAADASRWAWGLACRSVARAVDRTGYVYVVQQRWMPESPVKIGRAVNPRRRLTQLQLSCPTPLGLVGLMHGEAMESELHRRFARHRLHGEWFDSAELQDWLRSFDIAQRCEGCR